MEHSVSFSTAINTKSLPMVISTISSLVPGTQKCFVSVCTCILTDQKPGRLLPCSALFVNNAAMNMGCMYLLNYINSLLLICPGVRLLYHMVVLLTFLVFKKLP